ncbi:hypothetical protein [Proteus mirabilis]|uniref:hypothetical protein n=1 Tax=Proteus mirabilis TaxID=584 RepID=UPI0034D3C487
MEYNDIQNWVQSVDLKNPENKRVLSLMQLLDRRLLDRLSSYLISGKISIEILYPVPINNISISKFLDTLDAKEETDLTALQRYRNNISKFDGYKSFFGELKGNTPNQLARISISPMKEAVQIKLDSLGIDGKAFNSVTELKGFYDDSTKELLPLENSILDEAKKVQDSYGYSDFVRLTKNVLNKFKQMYFVYSEDESVPFRIRSNDFSLRLAKRDHLDFRFNGFGKVFTKILTEMSLDFEQDQDGTGVIPLTNLVKRFPIKDAFNPVSVDSNNIYEKISYFVILHHVTYATIYGKSYFKAKDINKVNQEFDDINRIFNKLYEYSELLKNTFITKCINKGKFYAYSNPNNF